VRLTVNGDRRELPDGATVAELVRLTAGRDGQSARGTAVAVDAEVVPRSAWETTPLRDGQRIEVLRAIQGGAA
jgi:sulfur carrier protein